MNVYSPFRAKVKEVVPKTADVNLYDIELPERITYAPGQFFMVSLWGAGEVPISIASHSAHNGSLQLCIRKVGLVTSVIHRLKKGDAVWLRGPYGNGFPLELAEGREIMIIAGGIGIAPLRPLIFEFTEKGETCGPVHLIYGSRDPDDIIFRDEIEIYRQKGADVIVTVDGRNGSWDGNVGLVTDFLSHLNVDYRQMVAFVCGPEIMIKNATRDLSLMGMPDGMIITTLEAHMKCGVGTCGHCYAGCKYICKDGPVFSYKDIKEYRLI